MFFTGIIIAVMALAIIGVFHPIVIKTEYYTGVRYWWVFILELFEQRERVRKGWFPMNPKRKDEYDK